MTTRFSRLGSDTELLNSQAAWLAEQLREWHGHDLAAVSAADTILAQQSGLVDVSTLAFAECKAILEALTSDRVSSQPQPQEEWRIEHLRRLLALELDLRDSASG